MDKTKPIIVTGACGFIGSVMVRELIKRGHTYIVAVDPLENSSFSNISGLPGVEWVSDLCYVERYYSDVSALIHLGGISNTKYKNGRRLFAANVGATEDAMFLAMQFKCPLQFASSASVYGNDGLPLSLYAMSKKMAEQIIERSSSHLLQYHIFRYFNVYPSKETMRFEAHKGDQRSPHSKFTDEFGRFGEITVYSNGEQMAKRDFIDVEDLCKIQIDALYKNLPSGTYDLGTGKSSTFVDVANQVVTTEYPKVLDPEYRIRIRPYPSDLSEGYQWNTCADMAWRDKYGI